MTKTYFLYVFVQMISVIFMSIAYKYRDKTIKKVILKMNVTLKFSTIFLTLSILPLFLLILLRSKYVGSDYETYINLYYSIYNNSLSPHEIEWLSPGYRMVSLLFAGIFKDNYLFFFGFLGLLTLVIFYKVIWEESKNPTLSLFMFLSFCLYYQCFNQFRQMFAIVLVLYSYKYIKEKKVLAYIFLVVFAASFHKSAIIMIPFYWISQIKFNRRIFIFYSLLCIAAFFSIDILRILLKNTYYGQMYFGSQYDIVGKSSTYVNLIFRLFLLIFSLFFFKNVNNETSTNSIYYHMAFVCTIIQILTVRSYVFGRLTTYFFVYYILLLPNLIDIVFKGNQKKIIIFVVILLCGYHFVYYNSNNAIESGYREYKFIFQEDLVND